MVDGIGATVSGAAVDLRDMARNSFCTAFGTGRLRRCGFVLVRAGRHQRPHAPLEPCRCHWGTIPLEELLSPHLLARVDRRAAAEGLTRDAMLERLSMVELAALEAGELEPRSGPRRRVGEIDW